VDSRHGLVVVHSRVGINDAYTAQNTAGSLVSAAVGVVADRYGVCYPKTRPPKLGPAHHGNRGSTLT
jgi:hypothetical protein